MIRARRVIWRVISRNFAYVILIIASLFILFPIFWLFSGALKESKDLWAIPPIWRFNGEAFYTPSSK
jgi:ABC-type glycerol-3-phosphate transport system permease component